MKAFTRDYRITGEYHPLWVDYFRGMKPCVLDIEATGLDRSRCKVILIGLLVRTDSGVRITQFLAENHYEEAKVLDAAMDYIEEEGIGCLITFNGYAYDIPFINARLDACMDGRHLHMYHFDLYRFLRKSTDIRTRVSSMSQMSLEDHYGIFSDRGDTITGKESVTLFDQYAISGSSTLEKIILTHNREDVLHLHRLMYLALGDIPADPGSATARSIAPDLHTALAAYGFPAGGGRFSIRPAVRYAQGKGRSDILRIAGEQIRDPFSGAWFPDNDQPMTVTFSASSSSYEIEVPVSRRGEDLYIDLSFLLSGAANDDSGSDFSGNSGSDFSGNSGSDFSGNSGSDFDRSSGRDPYGAANDSDFNSNSDRNLGSNFDLSSGRDPLADPAGLFEDALTTLRNDPDLINGYLILNPRTINLLSKALVLRFCQS